ncbi:MAG TPA: M56 family metallopeptidase [Streptosporangiaceae bacterium]|nr:M56 family metallopeptidase [Streptosporangiaceae bacterium]
MPAVVVLLGAFAIAIVLAASVLAGASWPRRSPGTAIVLWQALGLAWGLAAVGALVGFGISGLIVARRADTGLQVTELAAQRVDRLVLDGSSIGPFGLIAALRMASLAAGIALLALLVWILAAAATAVLRARHRQRALLGLLAHDDPKVPGALVVDHPAAAAYCVPGLRSAIVISAGALDLLDADELAAVLAHERAHLRARHDLVLLPFTALLKAFRWSAIARAANAEVALLVEMLADDRARKRRPARELATALLRVGASGGGVAPAGALAVSGSTSAGSLADGELAARVTRLLRPPPAMRFPAKVGIGMLAALIVLAPAAALLIPL